MRLFEIAQPYKTDLAADAAIQTARQHFLPYIKAFYHDPPFYRGDEGGEYAAIVNPAATGRASAHTSNEYTVLMSGLNSWAAFPKRSHSIIGTTDGGRAADYGDNTYVVILPERFNVGVCSQYDIWFSFSHLTETLSLHSMNDFNIHFRELGSIASAKWATEYRKWEADQSTTIQDMKEKCHLIQEMLLRESHRGGNHLALYLQDHLDDNSPDDHVFRLVEGLIDPVKNRFSRMTNLMELHSLSEGKELWTDSPCMLVNVDYWEEFADEVLQND